MKLSVPVYRLKRRAKLIARQRGCALHVALDQVARAEGLASWSLLVAKASSVPQARTVFSHLQPGDLLLVGARPGQGKTVLSLDLALESIRAGRRGMFFSLDWTIRDVRSALDAMSVEARRLARSLEFDDSDEISADYVIDKLGQAPPGTLAVLDYLQLLDQRRDNPPLLDQVRQLRSFVRERRLLLVFTSQVRRTFDGEQSSCPDLDDIRLPNPLDLSLFDKTCFLNKGRMRFGPRH